MSFLIGRLARLRVSSFRIASNGYCSTIQPEFHNQTTTTNSDPSEDQSNARDANHDRRIKFVGSDKYNVDKIPRKDRPQKLAEMLCKLDDSKETVYGTLDAWIAFEQEFPIAVIRRALTILGNEEKWHKMVQVIKWMLSKGQGNTYNTYGQMILALDKDERLDEAHEFWERKLGCDYHSAPTKLCNLMFSIYFRNEKFDKVVKLYKEMEEHSRRFDNKSVVLKVAKAYENLGKVEEKDKILEKYKDVVSGGDSLPLEQKKRRFYKNPMKRFSKQRK